MPKTGFHIIFHVLLSTRMYCAEAAKDHAEEVADLKSQLKNANEQHKAEIDHLTRKFYGSVLGLILCVGFLGHYLATRNKTQSIASGSEARAPDSNCPLVYPPKNYHQQSVFQVEQVIQIAREQKNMPEGKVPRVCVLGQGVTPELLQRQNASESKIWPCFSSKMYVATVGNEQIGFLPSIVGGPYAVFVAEELFACGCELVIHLTQAGEITPHPKGSCAGASFFLLVEKALRDEGTSVHWQSPSQWSSAPGRVTSVLQESTFVGLKKKVFYGSSWSIDSPFRQTEDATAMAKAQGVHCVEMEAAALMAYANARGRPIVSFTQVENSNATDEEAEDDESAAALELISTTAAAWFRHSRH